MTKRYGIYDATVVNVSDPLRLDRIKVRVFEVLGNAVSSWIFPAAIAPYWSWKPVVGDSVLVQFRAGDIDRGVYWGTWYSQDEDRVSTVPAESRNEYPFHRIMQTPQGHKIEFKDIDTRRNPDTGQEEPIEDSAQYVKLTTVGGHVIDLVDAKNAAKISITHSGGTKIEIDPNGKVTIEANGDVDVKAQGDILLGGGGGSASGKVVTTNHICAFTGAPHPQGSANVKAST